MRNDDYNIQFADGVSRVTRCIGKLTDLVGTSRDKRVVTDGGRSVEHKKLFMPKY